MNNEVTLHLMTQDGQPFGSRRKCCEVCGRMVQGQTPYADSRQTYEDALKLDVPNYVKCEA